MGRSQDASETLERLCGDGVDRRDFMKTCLLAAAAVGLPASAGVRMAEAAAEGLKPSVIWLHFQECTGCTESLLRTSHPGLAELILDLISLDYHETLFAAAGHQIEDALHTAMDENDGKYICVVEGSVPVKENGIYCQIAGRTAKDMLEEVAGRAGAVIAIGSCAAWGGVQSAPPNPTGATGTPDLVKDKRVVALPGCPANPYNFLGTALQFVTQGKLPELDDQGRPKFAYGRTIHDDCERRPHFDAGRFALEFGDEGHKKGYCLYKLGCKGPVTHANCAVLQFGEVSAWPVGVGHPCFGCSEKGIGFSTGIHETVELEVPGEAGEGDAAVNPLVAGVAGVVGGAVAGAGLAAMRKKDAADAESETSGDEDTEA